MDLDTRHVRAFVAVSDEGTFTDAAIALGVSQAQVSRAVQRLESAVGTRLLWRDSRHVEFTPAGERVLVQSRRMLLDVAALEAAAAGVAPQCLMGYAWAALGEHTVRVQHAWVERGHGELVLVHSNTPSAGLLEGRCEVAVVRRAVGDVRLESTVIGHEPRVAALAADHELAQKEALRLSNFIHETVAVDSATGSTTPGLWGAGSTPTFVTTHGIDEWLTRIAGGGAVGISTTAAAAQYSRPGMTYRPVLDASTVAVRLMWWKARPPAALQELVATVRSAYARAGEVAATPEQDEGAL